MISNDIYENPKILDEYLLFHYGQQGDILSSQVQWPAGMIEALDFAKRTPVHFAANHVPRGLDLGCAVGRSAFEMSRTCEHVVGIDFSQGFIDAANRIKEQSEIGYSRLDEGNVGSRLLAKLPAGAEPSRVEFFQGDAMNLPEDLGSFDRVHAANLLCRLTEPLLLLNRLPSLVNKGGELVIATPCTWLETFTPRENWPTEDTFSWMKEQLSQHFELKHECDEPFLIRETARKFQWTRSMVTVWKRKNEAG